MTFPKDVSQEWLDLVMRGCPPELECTLKNAPAEDAVRVAALRQRCLDQKRQREELNIHVAECINVFSDCVRERYVPATFWRASNLNDAKKQCQEIYEDSYGDCVALGTISCCQCPISSVVPWVCPEPFFCNQLQSPYHDDCFVAARAPEIHMAPRE